jgi:hypothetical protein
MIQKKDINCNFRVAERKELAMMRFLSRLANAAPDTFSAKDPVAYESVVSTDSKVVPGVRFVINRMSFGRRMELSRRVREISQKVEFLEAGNALQERLEAGILGQQIDAMYLHWGLVNIEGLTIDGEVATAAHLIQRGPEELAREIVTTIKAQCGLGESERKN